MLISCPGAVGYADRICADLCWVLLQALGEWSALNNTSLNLTMFAPTNAAFDAHLPAVGCPTH